MARDRLTALQVKRAHEKGEPVLLPDGAGLYLRKQSASGIDLDAALPLWRPGSVDGARQLPGHGAGGGPQGSARQTHAGRRRP